MINMTRLLGTAILLLASHFALIICQPYRPSTSSLESEIHNVLSSRTDGNMNVFSARDDINRVIIIARDTSTPSESTASTTSASTSSEPSTSTSSSDTSAASTTSTSTSTSTSTGISSTSTMTTSISTTSSTSAKSTTTATSTTSSSSPTKARSSSTTTTTASATSTTSAEIAEWNRKGNIAAIIFSCCLISLFSGVSILHCARDRAKSKRIAARELANAKTVSTGPRTASRGGSTAELIPDRSSVMCKDNPFGEQRPQTVYSPVGSSKTDGEESHRQSNIQEKVQYHLMGAQMGIVNMNLWFEYHIESCKSVTYTTVDQKLLDIVKIPQSPYQASTSNICSHPSSEQDKCCSRLGASRRIGRDISERRGQSLMDSGRH